MTGKTELTTISNEQGLTGGGMADMAGETVAFREGGMRAFCRGTFRRLPRRLLLMAGEAHLLRGTGEHVPVIAGMGRMAIQTFPLPVGLMDMGAGTLRLVTRHTLAIAVPTAFEGKAFSFMAAVALPFDHRLMDDAAQQGCSVGAVGVMTLHTTALHGKIEMALPKGLVRGVAGNAEGIRLLNKQKRSRGAMAGMTGGTSLLHRRMDVFAQDGLSFVAGKTEIGAGAFQQPLVRAVMHLVAGNALPLCRRSMDACHSQFVRLFAMADIALIRGVLTKINAADHAVMEMTPFAIILLHRLVHDSLLVGSRQVRVTLHTALPGLALGRRSNTGRGQATGQGQGNPEFNFPCRHANHRVPF